jgi:hypothetical protein
MLSQLVYAPWPPQSPISAALINYFFFVCQFGYSTSYGLERPFQQIGYLLVGSRAKQSQGSDYLALAGC